VVAEAQLGLVRERGYRARALVRVYHEEVNGIGPDVQDTQSHTLTLPGRPVRMRHADCAAVPRSVFRPPAHPAPARPRHPRDSPSRGPLYVRESTDVIGGG